jgi:hypothetical protein
MSIYNMQNCRLGHYHVVGRLYCSQYSTEHPGLYQWGNTSLRNCASYPRPNPRDIISGRLLSSRALPPAKNISLIPVDVLFWGSEFISTTAAGGPLYIWCITEVHCWDTGKREWLGREWQGSWWLTVLFESYWRLRACHTLTVWSDWPPCLSVGSEMES